MTKTRQVPRSRTLFSSSSSSASHSVRHHLQHCPQHLFRLVAECLNFARFPPPSPGAVPDRVGGSNLTSPRSSGRIAPASRRKTDSASSEVGKQARALSQGLKERRRSRSRSPEERTLEVGRKELNDGRTRTANGRLIGDDLAPCLFPLPPPSCLNLFPGGGSIARVFGLPSFHITITKRTEGRKERVSHSAAD